MGSKKKSNVAGADICLVSMPTLPPEQICGQYFQSKCQNEKMKKYPEWDLARTTPSIELMKAQDQLFNADEKLAAKQKEYITRREHLDQQWAELAEKEKALRKSFISFNKFVRENQEKKERAERRNRDEKALHVIKDKEIVYINEKIEKMTDVRGSMEKYVGNFKIYEDYLSDVVFESHEFRSINDVLNRYDSLTAARKDLIERQKMDLESLEEERANMVHLMEEKTGVLMGLNNKLAELQGRYENAKNQAFYWDAIVNKVKNKATKHILEIDLVEESCWSLYVQMCKRKEVDPEVDKDNIEEQLLFIKRTIMEFKRIMKIAQKKVAKDIASVKTESVKSQ